MLDLVRTFIRRGVIADLTTSCSLAHLVPTALLMSIGMQESGCNRDATGARGEQGIMQVAGDACDPGDCKEPWYNIHKGAEILVSKMGGDPNGNIISALGQYNGWMPGMVRRWAIDSRTQRDQFGLPHLLPSLARWIWCRVRSPGSKGFLPRRVSGILRSS